MSGSDWVLTVFLWLVVGGASGFGWIIPLSAYMTRRGPDFEDNQIGAMFAASALLAPLALLTVIVLGLWHLRRGLRFLILPIPLWYAFRWLVSGIGGAYRHVFPARIKVPEARTVQQ